MKHWSNAFPWIARRSFFSLAGAAALTQIPVVRADQAETPRAPEIWTSAFKGTKVWGYVSKHSVVSGEPFDLMLSTGSPEEAIEGRVEFFRVGHHPPDGKKLIWTSEAVPVTHQLVSRTAAAIGAAWEPALDKIRSEGWPPGYYSADFIHAKTGVRELQIAQLVVLNPERSGKILLKLSTNTYQAYNAWGGHSLYPSEDEAQRGTIISFDRPTSPSFFEYEVYLARFLEELGAKCGFSVDYATDFDVHSDGTILSRYPLVIAGSHDEYWSKESFDAFENRIYRIGHNVIFPGANTAYCQVRFADINRPPDGLDLGRQLVCYKRLSDPITRRKTAIDPKLLSTTYFREEARRPESMLLGVAYQSWFPPSEGGPRYTYYVASTDAPFFSGTGYEAGDAAADVVGYEWDNRDPDGDGQRLWDRVGSRIALLPQEAIKVLFQGNPADGEGKPGLAEAVYFRSPAGAKVFTAGSIRWAWGLGKKGFEREAFKQFNENLILDFLQ